MSQHRRILDAIDAAATRDAIVLDTHQRQLADRLAGLPVQPARSPVKRPLGLYIHGPAGRGKSWLANAFFDAVPTPQKTRIHFHEFFDDLHRRIHDHHHENQALRRAIDDATAHSRILLFDELHVHDSGNARLLTRLLEHLVQRKTIVVATSNYEPDSLLPNPIWHHTFEPGIALIKKHFEIFHLSGSTDYRSTPHAAGTRFGDGAWTAVTSSSPQPCEPVWIIAGPRRFRVVAADPGLLRATFAQLCDSPVSTIEYLEWAHTYKHWEISWIPLFDNTNPEAQQRFIHLIDILVDADIRVTFVSPHSLTDFLAAATGRPDAFRMTSRMQLLQNNIGAKSRDGSGRGGAATPPETSWFVCH